MPKAGILCAAWVLTLMAPCTAAAQSDLERARMLYNSGQFDASIVAATTAQSEPSAVSSATLIIARARLERFRKLGDPTDLARARTDLVSLNPRTLAPQESIEWQIGVGVALFLENQLGSAAETFTTILPSARVRLQPDEFEKLLEWWGAARSRLAETLTGDARKHAYESLWADARLELARTPLSRPATYWSVISSTGAGDLEAAWGAAIAGWIRAGNGPDGQQLRADLDAFVTETLIPDRARGRTEQRLDVRTTIANVAALNEEWRAVTARWDAED